MHTTDFYFSTAQIKWKQVSHNVQLLGMTTRQLIQYFKD